MRREQAAVRSVVITIPIYFFTSLTESCSSVNSITTINMVLHDILCIVINEVSLLFSRKDSTMSHVKQVIVYSAPWCGFCHAVKQYLNSIGVEYVEKDVDANPQYATESVEKSGQMGIPVIDIDGSIVVGFDRATIDRLLEK